MAHPKNQEHRKLGQFLATAICGNGILSSALYVSGIAVIFAGVWAPIVLLLIAGVLFLYKAVYTEVVEALPINGGAYNCLLNGTSKTIAGIGGILTFLSYIATAVISAKIGIEYLSTTIRLPVIPTTILLLLLFAVLVTAGTKDSARVALGIFAFHIATLAGFLVFGLLYYLNGHSEFASNIAHTGALFGKYKGMGPALYLAFSASFLGVSGFESSANFVEEQKTGVFRKTLRNMLIGVAIFNPLIALAVLNAMPYEQIARTKDFLLAEAAYLVGGSYFQYIVAIDAFLVLSGAVLAAYIGVSGLLSRMASDQCVPFSLGRENSRGAYPRIAFAFFFLCASILLLTRGELLSLAGVYTISFLGVMCMFAVGNLILKETRKELKRTYHAPIPFVLIAFLATFFGIIGNIRIDEENLRFFEWYFIPAFLLVLGIIYQDRIIRFILHATKKIPPLHRAIFAKFRSMTTGEFVVFIQSASRLYSILRYINRNETGWNITLVHCIDPDEEPREAEGRLQAIEAALPHLKNAGVFPHLNVTLICKNKPFGPAMIDEVSEELNIPKNRIFIGSIHHTHSFAYDELGGARIIF